MDDLAELGLEGVNFVTDKYFDTVYDHIPRRDQLHLYHRNGHHMWMRARSEPRRQDDAGGHGNGRAGVDARRRGGASYDKVYDSETGPADDDGRHPPPGYTPTVYHHYPPELDPRAARFQDRRRSRRWASRSRTRSRSRSRGRSNEGRGARIGTNVVGALAGGLAGRELTNGGTLGAVAGALVGALGAGAMEERYKERVQRERRKADKWDKERRVRGDRSASSDDGRERGRRSHQRDRFDY